MTQPVFDCRGFASFLQRIGGSRIPIVAGLMPLESLRHAEFMANEVPGVFAPPELLERMARADSAGRAAAEGIEIVREVAAEIRPLVQGLQISTSPGALDAALQVMKAVAA